VDIRLDPNDPRNQNLLRLKQLVLQTHESYLSLLDNNHDHGENGDLKTSTAPYASLQKTVDDKGRDKGNSNDDDDDDALARLPFHMYWGMKKMFRLSLPDEFHRRALGSGSSSTSPKRLDILERRWTKRLYFRGPVPLEDELIDESMYEELNDPLKDDVSKRLHFKDLPSYLKRFFPLECRNVIMGSKKDSHNV
jgi:hypothetical protein